MMFNFYSDQSTVTHTLEAGLHIDSIKTHCTEEKRVTYNSTNPSIPQSKSYVEEPAVLVYYVSRPCNDETSYGLY